VLLYFILPETVDKNSYKPSDGRKNRIVELFESLKNAQFGTLNAIYFFLVVSFSIMTYAFVLYTIERFGYTAEQNGYIFAFIGFLAIIFQGGLFARLAERFGETPLMIVGCLIMAASLFMIPYVAPDAGGLSALLIVTACLAIGNSMASPAVMSVVSKISDETEQGKSLGVMQSGASLARAIGPALGGVLLNNSLDHIDNFTIQRTFWTASVIMIVAALIAIFFAKMSRKHAIA
jgi:MFS family permease